MSETEQAAPARVLIVDDEADQRAGLGSLVSSWGFAVETASDGQDALEKLASFSAHVIVTDLNMPRMDGFELLRKLTVQGNSPAAIVLTAFGSIENAIKTVHDLGAFWFLEKPIQASALKVLIERAASQGRLAEETDLLHRQLSYQGMLDGLVGGSPAMQEVFSMTRQVAPSKAAVLVTGESGTGKELVARAIHGNSPRSKRPFIPVNSGSLPPDLLESNLFGHVKGAFTGAVAPKKGLFELADQGSIFLDEIGTVPLDTQAKLLRVIQEREFMRLGGVDTIKVDVRIIAATNVDLKRLVDDGAFREDLFYRLNVIVVELPPLRERREDVPLLAHSFLDKYSRQNDKTGLELSADALALLERYHWPGNVRELENAIERAVVLASGSQIGISLIPDTVRNAPAYELPDVDLPPDGLPFKKVVEGVETRLITQALEASGGVQKRAAELLQVKPSTLNEMIKRSGIRPRRKRPSGGPV